MKMTARLQTILETTREIMKHHYDYYLTFWRERKIPENNISNFVKMTIEEIESTYTPSQFKRTISQLLRYPFVTEMKDAYTSPFEYLSDMYDIHILHKPASSASAKLLRARQEEESKRASTRFICPDFNFEASLGKFKPVFGDSFRGQPYSLDVYEETLIRGYTREEYYMSAAYLAPKQTEEERLAWEFDNIVTADMCPAFPPVENAVIEQVEPIAVISETEAECDKSFVSYNEGHFEVIENLWSNEDEEEAARAEEEAARAEAEACTDSPHYLTYADIEAYCAVSYYTSGDNDFDEQSIIEIEAYLNSSSEEPTIELPDSGIIEAAEPVIEEPVIEEAEEDFIEEEFIDEEEEEYIEEDFIDEDDEDGFEWSIEDIEQPTELITEAVLPETEEQPEPVEIMPEAENINNNEEPVAEESTTALQIAEEEPSINVPAESTVNVTPDVVNDDDIFELFLSEHNEFKTILDEINSNYSIIVYKANYILGHASEFRGKKYLRKSSTAFIEMFKEGLDKLVKYTKDTKESFIYTLKLGRLEKIAFFLKEFEDRAYQFRLGLDAITRAEAAYSGVTSFEFKAI